VVDGEKPGVDSRDEGKHTGRNDLLFVATMMSISRHGGLYTVEKSSVNLRKSSGSRLAGTCSVKQRTQRGHIY